eukprot:EG_transcript_10226
MPACMDPTLWAKQAETLHTLQAATTEVAALTTPDDGTYRGVRWLRDVLRNGGAESPPKRSHSGQPPPVDSERSSVVRRRGIVVGREGEYKSTLSVCGGIPPSRTCSELLGADLLGLPPDDPPLPRRGSANAYLEPPRPGRLRSLSRCPSQLDPSDDDELSPR